RLRADHRGLHARRADGALLGQRRAHLPDLDLALAGEHELAAEALDDLVVDLDPEARADRWVDPPLEVGERNVDETVLHRVRKRLELEQPARRRVEGDGDAGRADDPRRPGVR